MSETTSTDEPWFVREQRARKAERLVTALRISGKTVNDVVHLSLDERRAVEADAAIRKGSPKTWRLVADMMAGSTNPDALCPTCGIGDPEGVDGPPKPYGHRGACAR
jgi:hypothetical protein